MIWRPSFGTEDVLQLEGVGPRMMDSELMMLNYGMFERYPKSKGEIFVH